MDGSAAVALNGNRLREGPISQQHSRYESMDIKRLNYIFLT